MSVRWPVGLVLCLALVVAAAPVRAQTGTGHLLSSAAVSPSPHRFRHGKTLRAEYDSLADSTRLSLVTHNGMHFLTIRRPRLTWSVLYQGQARAGVPAEVLLEFRTQEPQSPRDSRLTIRSAGGRQFEVASAGASSDPDPMTWSLFMRFPIPTTELAGALAGDSMVVSVGGVVQRFKRDQLEALRDLLSRVGAWPAASDRS